MNKYKGDVSKVTDCARISLEFETAEGLEKAAKFVLPKAACFKNRVANPTLESYRDLMFKVVIDGHVCEVNAPQPPCDLPCLAALLAGGGGGGGRRGVGRWYAVGIGASRASEVRPHAAPTRRDVCHHRRCSCTWWR